MGQRRRSRGGVRRSATGLLLTGLAGLAPLGGVTVAAAETAPVAQAGEAPDGTTGPERAATPASPSGPEAATGSGGAGDTGAAGDSEGPDGADGPERTAGASPSASISHDCSMTGAEVLLGNASDELVSFEVIVDGVRTPHELGASGRLRLSVPVPEDDVVDITVEADGAELATRAVARDCETPPAVLRAGFEVECGAEPGAVVTVRSTGPATPSPVEVLRDGAVVGTATVAADATVESTHRITEDRTVTFAVRRADDGVLVGAEALTPDCVQVGRARVSPPPDPEAGTARTLPRTGPDPAPLAALGTSLVLAGSTALAGSARRRRAVAADPRR